MTRRILFTSQKGGVGKSVLARSMAVALATLDRKVLLADFDIEQRTCMRWQAQRQARSILPSITVAPFGSMKKLDRFLKETPFDDVVMDTRGHHDELSLELAVAADVTFLPSSFSMDDVAPTLKVVESLRNAGVANTRIAIVFCRTGGSTRQEQQARSIFVMNKIAVLKEMLPQRDGFTSLYATGRSGRNASSPSLRSIALTLDQALLEFVDAATGKSSPSAHSDDATVKSATASGKSQPNDDTGPLRGRSEPSDVPHSA
jgi:chromosome partitioning protein